MSEAAARTRRGRSGGGAARRAERTAVTIDTAPTITRNIPNMEVLNEEALQIIEANAETVLEEIGVNFVNNPGALQRWRDAGADVQGERVHIPRGLARKLCATAPSSFTQHARNPAKNVEIGGKNLVLAPVYGPPFVRDLEGNRRYATIEDFRNFVKLAYMAPSMHHSGGTVCEPVDIPVNKRHLDMVYAHMRYSDKPFMGSVTAPDRAEDTVEMCKRLFGADFVDANCVVINLINANSPLVYDGTMLGALKVYARANQACVVSPFILAGAMSPVTVAGTLTQLFAEALAGMALTQLCRPGAPVVFGTFASSISMQSGAPTFGTPEPALVLYGAAQLARRLGVPFRSGGNLCGSKIADAQAAYESAQTFQPTLNGGGNFVLHAAGWLEGGLTVSYEKIITDLETLQMVAEMCAPTAAGPDEIALDAHREVMPSGHFFGCAHTMARYQTEFYQPLVADWSNYGTWEENGSRTASERATGIWKKILQDDVRPAVDEAKLEEMHRDIAKRTAAGGAPPES